MRRGKHRLCGRLLAAVPLLIGLALLVSAVAQPIKAHVGRSLLASTFDARMAASIEDRADPDQWRPWPWADLAPVAELRFPTLGEQRVIVDSASGEALAWGAGHMPDTAPLGAPGVSVVAGHRDGAFELLGRVHEGDVVELTTVDGEVRRYRIDERTVVHSGRVQLPIVHTGPDELVLTTCWPIDALISGPERLVMRGVPVP